MNLAFSKALEPRGKEALALPNLTGDPVAFANARQSCERALAAQQVGDDGDLTKRLRAVLLSSQGRWPTEAEMAVRFAMSPSTLMRRLRQTGHTYLGLREATRREKAQWLLRQSRSSRRNRRAAGLPECKQFQGGLSSLVRRPPVGVAANAIRPELTIIWLAEARVDRAVGRCERLQPVE
jgi:AraC-like DNA-binding protein